MMATTVSTSTVRSVKAASDLRAPHEVLQGDQGDERGVLEEGDELAAHRGKHPGDRLRQHDASHDLPGRHAEREARMPLSARDGENAGAVYLGEIRARVEAERDGTGDEGGDPDAGQDGEREVNPDELGEQRRAAEDVDVDARDDAQGGQGGHAYQRDHQPQEDRDDHRENGDLHRDHRPGHQEAEVLEHGGEVPLHAQASCASRPVRAGESASLSVAPCPRGEADRARGRPGPLTA